MVSGSIRLLRSGVHQLGVRWKTVRWPTVLAISVMACTPEAPVPMMATRLFAKLTGRCGHRPVCHDSPLKSGIPGITGMVGDDSGPMAVIRKRARACLPSSKVTSHSFATSSQCAAFTRALKVMSRRRSNLSARNSQ